jgi:hypothetical protein
VATGSSIEEEPSLTIPRPPRFWARPFGWPFAVAAVVAAVGLLGLGLQPDGPAADPIITLKGIMASKRDFFEDPAVQRLLLEQHHIRVEVTPRGSREVALEVIAQPDRYDFAFPSGQPTADLIKKDRSQKSLYNNQTRLFTSPIVLASYHDYAATLAGKEVAEPHGPTREKPLYYTLDTAEFIKLGEQGKTWNDIGIKPVKNGNRVLARTPGACRANSAGTYVGLVAFVKNGLKPAQTEAEVDQLAEQIKPLITATGMAESDLFEAYVTPEGKSQGPIVVVYEHQYFAYQLDRQRRTGTPDTDRVLLYPSQEFQTDPEFISLNEEAERLAEVLDSDPDLRKRMMELGYRVLDGTSTTGTEQLFQYLNANGVPVPAERSDLTRAELPELDLLEKLIRTAGRCRE